MSRISTQAAHSALLRRIFETQQSVHDRQIQATSEKKSQNINQRNEGKEKMPERKYINKCKIVEKVFEDNGYLLNVYINVDELVEMADSDGWVNLTIAKRMEVSDKGATHYAYENEFKPQKQAGYKSKTDDGLPF